MFNRSNPVTLATRSGVRSQNPLQQPRQAPTLGSPIHFVNERLNPDAQYTGFVPPGRFQFDPFPQHLPPPHTSTAGQASDATADESEIFDLGGLDFGGFDSGIVMSSEEINAFLSIPLDELLSKGIRAESGSSDNAPAAGDPSLPSLVATNQNASAESQVNYIGETEEAPVDEGSSHVAKPTQWEPSSAVDSVTLQFDTEAKYRAYKSSQKESRPYDSSLPTTWDEMMPHVLRLKKAMIDISQAEDTKSNSFKKRWLNTLLKLFYEDAGIEDICWEIVNKAIDLHLHGIGILNCHDPEQIKNYKTTMDLSFQQRMDKMVEYVMTTKARVDTLMKHDALDTFVAIPHKLISTSKANRTFNEERGKVIKAGRAARQSGFAATPTPSNANVGSSQPEKSRGKRHADTALQPQNQKRSKSVQS